MRTDSAVCLETCEDRGDVERKHVSLQRRSHVFCLQLQEDAEDMMSLRGHDDPQSI